MSVRYLRWATPGVEETLNTSIVDVFSGREFGADPNSLPQINHLRDRFASGTSFCRGNADFFSVAFKADTGGIQRMQTDAFCIFCLSFATSRLVLRLRLDQEHRTLRLSARRALYADRVLSV
jgi:hypothetical protein